MVRKARVRKELRQSSATECRPSGARMRCANATQGSRPGLPAGRTSGAEERGGSDRGPERGRRITVKAGNARGSYRRDVWASID